MKKSILNLGNALNKAEQKQISGGIIGREYYCYEGGRALVACMGGSLLGYCRNITGSIYTINFGPCL